MFKYHAGMSWADKMDDLFVDPEQVIRDSIAAAVRPYARLAQTGWAFFADPAFFKLDAQVRLLVVLMGRKASQRAGKVESDALEKDDLCALAGVNENTYRPYAPR